MKNVAYLYFIAVMTLYGCQSAPKAAPEVPKVAEEVSAPVAPVPVEPEVIAVVVPAEVPEPSSIVAGDTGFSPKAQAPANTLLFQLHFGSANKVVSWIVDFASADGVVTQLFKDNAPNLPATLSWDGRGESGELVAEGTYKARLTVDYGGSGEPTIVESDPFVVDVTPPSGSLEVFPQPFEPGDPQIMVNPPEVTIQVNLVAGGAAIASWRLGVIHPDGRRFFDFISEDHRDNVVKWNGRASNNASMEAGITYDLVAQVFDRYGNVGLIQGSLSIAAIPEPISVAVVEEIAPVQEAPVAVVVDGNLIAETQIYFPAFSSNLAQVEASKAAKNAEALQKVAEALNLASGVKIAVIGHANKVFWQDEEKGQREQKEVLLPLSLSRAEAVRDALVQLGIDPGLFEVSGVGASDAVAPFGDLVNNWKNRRVEFVVEL